VTRQQGIGPVKGRFHVDDDAVFAQEIEDSGCSFGQIGFVGNGKDEGVELAEILQLSQAYAIFLFGLRVACHRVVHQRFQAELVQFTDNIGHAAVAQVGHVFLEGQAKNADAGAVDRLFRRDQHLDELLGDEGAHAVIDAAAGQDDFRVIA